MMWVVWLCRQNMDKHLADLKKKLIRAVGYDTIHRRKAQPPAQLVEWDSPPWGKTFAFPPKGGLANRSFFTGRPLKSGSLLMLHPISFVLFLNILLYRLFIYITDCLAIISSCPEMTIPFLSIFWMSVKYHKRTFAFNKTYSL